MKAPSLLWGTRTFPLCTSRSGCSSLAVQSATPSPISPKCQWAVCVLTFLTCAILTSPRSTALWATSLTTSVGAWRAKFKRPGITGKAQNVLNIPNKMLDWPLCFLSRFKMLTAICSPQEVFLLWTCILLHVHDALFGGKFLTFLFSYHLTHPVILCMNTQYVKVSLLQFYLQSRFTWHGARLLRPLTQFTLIMMSFYTGLSRVSDHKHHPTDVLAGFVQGALVAYCIVSGCVAN